MSALTKPQLDKITAGECGTPGCTHDTHGLMFLHARCHIEAAVEASYQHDSGQLKIACAQCKKVVAYVAVAEQASVLLELAAAYMTMLQGNPTAKAEFEMRMYRLVAEQLGPEEAIEVRRLLHPKSG